MQSCFPGITCKHFEKKMRNEKLIILFLIQKYIMFKLMDKTIFTILIHLQMQRDV